MQNLLLLKQLHRLLAVLLVVLTLTLSSITEANAAQVSKQGIDGNAALKDIPNVEQMNQDTLKRYFGDVPDDHKPLFNPDNGKNLEIKDKKLNNKILGGDRTIKPENMKDSPDVGKSQ